MIDANRLCLITIDKNLPAPQNRAYQRLADVKAEQLTDLSSEQLDLFFQYMAQDPETIEEQLPTKRWYTWKHMKDLHLEMQVEYSYQTGEEKAHITFASWLEKHRRNQWWILYGQKAYRKTGVARLHVSKYNIKTIRGTTKLNKVKYAIRKINSTKQDRLLTRSRWSLVRRSLLCCTRRSVATFLQSNVCIRGKEQTRKTLRRRSYRRSNRA